MTRRPVCRPPVNETRSTRGSSASSAPASGPAPSTRLPTPAGSPASSSSRIRWMLVCGVSSLGLSTKVLPAARQGATFQLRLEQRVVPRRDQPADAERLVDDPADHVGVAGVDDPAGVLGGDPAVVAEHRDHVGDVVLALDQALAGVRGLGLGHGVHVTLEQVGGAEQEVAALAGGRRRPRSLVEGAVRRVDRGRGVLGPGLVDLTDDPAVGRADDRAAAARERAHPRSVDVEVWHPVVPFATSGVVASCATRCGVRNVRSRPPACRCPSTRLRDQVGVALEQVGGAKQEVAALPGRRAGPGSSWKARCAAPMAAAASSGPASSISATTRPSAGQTIVRRPPASALTHDPST